MFKKIMTFLMGKLIIIVSLFVVILFTLLNLPFQIIGDVWKFLGRLSRKMFFWIFSVVAILLLSFVIKSPTILENLWKATLGYIIYGALFLLLYSVIFNILKLCFYMLGLWKSWRVFAKGPIELKNIEVQWNDANTGTVRVIKIPSIQIDRGTRIGFFGLDLEEARVLESLFQSQKLPPGMHVKIDQKGTLPKTAYIDRKTFLDHPDSFRHSIFLKQSVILVIKKGRILIKEDQAKFEECFASLARNCATIDFDLSGYNASKMTNILVFKNGEFLYEGTHIQLIKEKSDYVLFWMQSIKHLKDLVKKKNA